MIAEWVMSPAGIALLAILLVIGSIYYYRVIVPEIRRSRLRDRSRKWPEIQARLDHACVTEYRPSDRLITYRLDAWFTYTIAGKEYDGMYANDDMRLEKAKRMLSQFHTEPVMVRFNPAKPAEYYFEPKFQPTPFEVRDSSASG